MLQDVDLNDGTPCIHSINGQMFAVISLDALRALQDGRATPCPQTVERIVEWLRRGAIYGDHAGSASDYVFCQLADAIAAGEPWKGDE